MEKQSHSYDLNQVIEYLRILIKVRQLKSSNKKKEKLIIPRVKVFGSYNYIIGLLNVKSYIM